MKAIVDPDLCTGCELCTQLCPVVFHMNGDVAVGGDVPEEAEEEAQEAAEGCPSEAISIEE